VPLGFFTSALLFYLSNLAFPVNGVKALAQYDDIDVYGTFTPREAERLGVAPLDEDTAIVGVGEAAGEESNVAGQNEGRIAYGREGNLKL
jgi:NCS1 family nucleobase:cation symporter-1